MTETPAAIRTERLTKRYGTARGVAELDLEVPAGEVFGFLGPNGAGKSTTIRLLLDLLRPTSGRAELFGVEVRAGGPALRRRVSYLAGDFAVDGRQPAQELLTYLGHLRGGVPQARIRELAERLQLDLGKKVAAMSKGNRQKVGLVQAFMAEPELLILDEPTSGLDPLVSQEFLTMVREARANDQTVFMSSHIMSEVQQTADRVGIVREGQLVTVERVETLRGRALRDVEVRFVDPVASAEFAALPGVHDLAVDGDVLTCRLSGSPDAFVKELAGHEVRGLLFEEPDLEDLFVHYYVGVEAADAA